MDPSACHEKGRTHTWRELGSDVRPDRGRQAACVWVSAHLPQSSAFYLSFQAVNWRLRTGSTQVVISLPDPLMVSAQTTKQHPEGPYFPLAWSKFAAHSIKSTADKEKPATEILTSQIANLWKGGFTTGNCSSVLSKQLSGSDSCWVSGKQSPLGCDWRD